MNSVSTNYAISRSQGNFSVVREKSKKSQREVREDENRKNWPS